MVKPADFRPRFERKNPQLRHCEVTAACPECALYGPAKQGRDMMRRFRILTALAALSIMTAGGAAAQAETDTAPGNPIPLLKILAKPDKTRTKIPGKRVGRRVGKTHMATKTRALLHRSAKARPAAPTAAADDALPTNVAAAPSAAPPAQLAAASPPPTAPFAEPMPSELVVGGRTVQVTAPDNVNAIDEAAGTQRVAASAATAAARLSDGAEAEPASEATTTVARAQPERSPVGSASWIMQILAALGGAFAAGSAAWFLIGSAPQRTYG
jgi:hypothetical protein